MAGVGSAGREGTPMLKVVHDAAEANEATVSAGGSLLDEIVRDGARAMLAAALQAEVAAYVEAHAEALDGTGIGWWSATVTTSAQGDHGRRRGGGAAAAGQRQAHRRSDRAGAPVLFGDPAGVGA